MEIINERSGEKPFNEIVWGECFLDGDDLCLRVKGPDRTAVRLSDGELTEFNNDYMVQPVEAKVIVP